MTKEPGKTKILVIDDDPDIVTAVRMTLEGAGYQVASAASGQEGVKMVRSENPDMIILDVMLETHTEGFQLALKLHIPDPASELARFKDIPILMLTAIHSTTPVRYEPDIDYLPVELFVDKPIDPEDLKKKVAWVLSRTRPR